MQVLARRRGSHHHHGHARNGRRSQPDHRDGSGWEDSRFFAAQTQKISVRAYRGYGAAYHGLSPGTVKSRVDHALPFGKANPM
jgi:hypothetical protein